jgi:hypothetical protein
MILAILVGGIFFRFYIFQFPASLIGVDPDINAINSQQVILEHSFTNFDVPFYKNVPLFFSLVAVFGILTGQAAPDAMMVFPLILGTTSVLLPLLFSRAVLGGTSAIARKTISGTVLLASLGTTSVLFSYWPIVQSLSVPIWLFTLWLLARYMSSDDYRTLIILFISLFVAMLAHKLPILLFLGYVAVLISLVKIIGYEGSNHSLKDLFIICTLCLFTLFFQWMYLTDFIDNVIFKGFNAFTGGRGSITGDPIEATGAKPAFPGLYGIMIRRGYALILVPLTGLSWMYVLYTEKLDSTVLTLLSSSAAVTMLLFIAVIAPTSLAPPRLVFSIEPVFLTLSGLCIVYIFFSASYLPKKVCSILLLFLLLSSQVISGAAVPDFQDNPRYYLTNEEVAGKQFGNTYVEEEIYTDWYFAGEVLPASIRQMQPGDRYPRTGTNYKSLSGGLINQTVQKDSPEFVMIRSEVDVYRLSTGFWRLKWNPSEVMDHNSARIYSNGGVGLFNT